ncbi:PAS domain-containing protein [Nakamurella sp. YIM 132087]|uniref:protein-glutamate O-methyltransferase n=1 Tax=Nakamurella alba TaxID=2665158 RepID=A0A7K1FN39_9ACTN|nr:CheR family methyltransferase [Nakamurella alba]MTD14643.1 PAS domain-containing protein [Nakamurella alba]
MAEEPTEKSGASPRDPVVPRVPESRSEPSDPAFEGLLQYLKESRAFDFTGYKRASLKRRVQHHMRSVGLSTWEEYHDHLQVHPEEFTTLFNTILINVTSFFRDREAWDLLADHILPGVLAGIGDNEPIRIWSAGCATGQEAYSLAMMLAARLGTDNFRGRVKIYATDVDEEALAVARQAVYTDKEVADLPEGYLQTYFEPAGGGRWIFHRDLRRSVIFGRNDLVQDAPISRIDLLACRNALMYFNAETQSRIVSRLGFALKPNGVLFLGKAEMLLNHTATFEPIDLKRRFFRKAVRSAVENISHPHPGPAPSGDAPFTDVQHLRNEAFLASPVAQIVLNTDNELAMVNHRAATLLSLSERDVGRPFHELEVSYRPTELRAQLAAVQDTRMPVWLHDLEWNRTPNEALTLDVQLVPMIDGRSRLLGVTVLFTDVTRFRQLQRELESTNRQLETAYEELQSTNEELETTNEELQSTVEELETTNEELQSTNEELETMNEELQSMNDELQVTNEELRDRTNEISSLNHFMEAILGSLRAGVVVVNRDMIVQVWNRQAEDLWGLREQETVGTHFLNLDSGLPVEQLKTIIREVISETRESAQIVVSAINRRGRPIELQITATPLLSGGPHPGGALLMMETTEEQGPG